MRSYWRGPLSLKTSREIREELSKPPADTPARRKLFALVDEMAEVRRRSEEKEAARAAK